MTIPGVSRCFHRTYLGGIERGERKSSLKNLAAIAKALNVRLADLLNIDAR
ncbi:helix-turn-helix domain-containing protein [Chloroflexota bacterium]